MDGSSTTPAPTDIGVDKNYLLTNLVLLLIIWSVASCLTWYGLSKLGDFVMKRHPRKEKTSLHSVEKSLSKLKGKNSGRGLRRSKRRIELTYVSDCLCYCEITPKSDVSFRPVYWSYFQLFAMSGLISSFIAVSISLYQSTVEPAVMRGQSNKSPMYRMCIASKILFFFTFGAAYVSFSLFWFERLIVTFEKGAIEYQIPRRAQYAVYSIYAVSLALGIVAVCVRLSQGGGDVEYRESKDENPFRRVNKNMTTCEWTTTSEGDNALLILTAFYGTVFTCVNVYLAAAYVRRLKGVMKAVSQRRTLARKSSPLPALRYEIKTGSNATLAIQPALSLSHEVDPQVIRAKSQSQPLPPKRQVNRRNRTNSIIISTTLSKEEKVIRKTAVIALVSFSSTIICFVIENAVNGIGFLFEFDILVNCVCMVCVFEFANHLYRLLFHWIEEICLRSSDESLSSDTYIRTVTNSMTEIDLSEFPTTDDDLNDELNEDGEIQAGHITAIEIEVENDSREED